MLAHIRPAASLLIALTILTGLIYPAIVTALAQLAFRRQANGSLVLVDNKVVGSECIGQQFSRDEYFWGRLSATSPTPYNAAASSGSNLGPLNPALVEAAKGRIDHLKSNTADNAKVPVDLVTASGSGLDPHISPAAAEYQLPRVAKLRKIKQETLRAAVQHHTQSRQWGILGEPRVNVLMLNLELDRTAPLDSPAHRAGK